MICKSLLGVIYISCLYTAIKYLPLVVASLIQNLSPLFIAIFSCIFLKNGLTKLKTAVLIVSFIGVVVMITGKLELTYQLFDPDPDLMEDDVIENDNSLTDDLKQITVSLVIPIIMMLCVPIMNAFITILFAKMRGLSELTVCSYQDLILVLFFGPILWLTTKDGFSYFSWFNNFEYLAILGAGISSGLVQVFRMKSVQYHEPAKLAVLNYFQSVFQLLFDILFFQVDFTNQ